MVANCIVGPYQPDDGSVAVSSRCSGVLEHVSRGSISMHERVRTYIWMMSHAWACAGTQSTLVRTTYIRYCTNVYKIKDCIVIQTTKLSVVAMTPPTIVVGCDGSNPLPVNLVMRRYYGHRQVMSPTRCLRVGGYSSVIDPGSIPRHGC